MNKYLKNIIKQYKFASGEKNIDLNSELFIDELVSFIRQRKIAKEEYKEFLYYLNDYLALEKFSAEVGKGRYDTVFDDEKILLITPYSEGIITSKKRLKIANLYVNGNTPIIINQRGQIERIYNKNINRFITENPYNSTEIKNWDQLHNGGSKITLGVYGSLSDKDMDTKIKEIKKIKEKLKGTFREEYDILNGNYFYAISSSIEDEIKCIRQRKMGRKNG